MVKSYQFLLVLIVYLLLSTGELVQHQKEAKNVERNISQLQHDMVKLNTLVANKKSEQEDLEQGNLLMEGDFVHTLKVCNMSLPMLGSVCACCAHIVCMMTMCISCYYMCTSIGCRVGVNSNAE